jgi:hypothetical protein
MPEKSKSLSPEQEARIARDQAQRIEALWRRPVLTDVEAAEALSLPHSSWCLLKRSTNPAPPVLFLGRRAYVKTSDLLAWVDASRST